MPNINDVKRLVEDMHERKILNKDLTLTDLLAVQGDHIVNPGQSVGWYIVGGDHFVLVCGQSTAAQTVKPSSEKIIT